MRGSIMGTEEISKLYGYWSRNTEESKSYPVRVNALSPFKEYVLERVSFGSKECNKELKLECAYFLGQTSYFLSFRLHQ